MKPRQSNNKLRQKRRSIDADQRLRAHLRLCAGIAREMRRRNDWPWTDADNRRGP